MPDVKTKTTFVKVKCPACQRVYKVRDEDEAATLASLPASCECSAPKVVQADPTLATEHGKLIAQHDARLLAIENAVTQLRGDLAAVFSLLEQTVNAGKTPSADVSASGAK